RKHWPHRRDPPSRGERPDPLALRAVAAGPRPRSAPQVKPGREPCRNNSVLGRTPYLPCSGGKRRCATCPARLWRASSRIASSGSTRRPRRKKRRKQTTRQKSGVRASFFHPAVRRRPSDSHQELLECTEPRPLASIHNGSVCSSK